MGTAPIGRKQWAIAEGYIPGSSTGDGRAFESHETACLLNAGCTDAHVEITLYFADRQPVGPYRLTVPARRTLHLRFNDLTDPAPVPRDTDMPASSTPISRSSSNTRDSTPGSRAGAALDGGFPRRLTSGAELPAILRAGPDARWSAIAAQIVRGGDQRDVRERLREVADLPLSLRVVFFGQQAHIVAECDQSVEQLVGLVHASHHRQ